MKQIKSIQGNPLMFEAVYDDGKNFWFTEYNYNAFFKINKISKDVQFIGNFPNEDFIQKRLYISMDVWDKKIYFAPYAAKEIAIYDLEKKIFEKLKINLPRKNNFLEWEKQKFHRVIAVKDKIYFIPYYYPGLLCYDTKIDKFSCLDDWIDVIEEKRKNNWGYFLEVVLVDNKLILPCACADIVLIFNTVTQKFMIMQTPPSNTDYQCGYCGISYINGYYYLLSADGSLSKRKLEMNEEEIDKISLPVCGENIAEFYPMKLIGDYIYFFPFKKNKCVKFNIETEQIIREKIFDDECKHKGDNCLVLTAFINDNKLYGVMGNSGCFIEYDLKNNSKKKYWLFPSEQDCRLIRESQREDLRKEKDKDIVVEDSMYSLDLMIEMLQTDSDLEEYKNGLEKCRSDSVIYYQIKELLL